MSVPTESPREPAPNDPDPDRSLTVLFDGSCPLCRREVAFFRRTPADEPIVWTDVSQARTADVAPGVSGRQAMARFHVVDRDGTIKSGAAAFLRLWGAFPRFRLAARIASFRPLASMLERAYETFLKARPMLQRWAARRETRIAAGRRQHGNP